MLQKRKPIDLKTIEGRRKFYNTNEWRILRRIKIIHNPFCEECLKNGQITLTEDIHHIIDIAEDPTKCLDIKNLQSLCKACHSKITIAEHRPHIKYVPAYRKWNY